MGVSTTKQRKNTVPFEMPSAEQGRGGGNGAPASPDLPRHLEDFPPTRIGNRARSFFVSSSKHQRQGGERKATLARLVRSDGIGRIVNVRIS